MSLFCFKILAVNGMDEEEIRADSIKVVDGKGNVLELHPRKSDGEIVLYARNSLVVRPRAANCAVVCDEV